MGRAKDEGILPHDLARLRRKLLSLAPAEHLSVVYEAGPTGYGLCRDLRAHGITCLVVAPNRVPQMPGPRVKTDKRDARHLAWQLRLGALDGIALPDEELEALRDLVRAREDTLYARRRTRQQLSGLLLRHGKRWSGKSTWTPPYRAWISSLRFGSEAQDATKRYYLGEVDHLDERISRLTEEVERLAETLSGVHGELYRFYQGFRGISTIVAVTLVCELGDLRRFPTASRLMGYVGMTPRELSSGSRVWRGAITKSGNAHVRRVLIEAAWSGRLRPARPKRLLLRQEGLPEEVTDIAWKAQERLYDRHRRMRARGEPQNVTIVATARELLGFVWSVAQHTERLSA